MMTNQQTRLWWCRQTRKAVKTLHTKRNINAIILFYFIFVTVLNSPPHPSKTWESTKLFNGKKSKEKGQKLEETQKQKQKTYQLRLIISHLTPSKWINISWHLSKSQTGPMKGITKRTRKHLAKACVLSNNGRRKRDLFFSIEIIVTDLFSL